jgi:hypothetical protein
MRNHRLARCLFCVVLLFTAASGCQTLYRYRPVTVLVRDADTKKPVPGAQVSISYPLTRPSLAPYQSCELTGDDGIARLRAAPYGSAGLRVEATAKGYMSEERNVLAETIKEIEPAPLLLADRPRPVTFVMEIYSEPLPTVELILPAGYRGLVKAEVQIQEDAPCPPGQRCFRYEVASGIAQVKGPPLLRRVCSSDYHARYTDGTLLGEEMDEGKVGFRWLKCEGSDQYFVVGTLTDYYSVHHELHLPEATTEHQTSNERKSGGGGRGGRHRRGGASASQDSD